MAQKLYDITVNINKYTDREGKTKYRSVNVGTMWQGEYGPFMRINRSFNPAGVPCKPEDDSILCNLWEPRPRDGRSATEAPARDPAPAKPEFDSDVPF